MTLWAAIAAGVLIASILLRGPGRTLLAAAAWDAGHVPLFALFAVAVLGVSRSVDRGRVWPRSRHYLLALLVTIVAGGAVEALQALGARDASLGDLARDAAGGAAALLLAWARDLRAAGGSQRKRAHPGPAVLLALVLLGVGLAPLAVTALAYVQRDAAFPVICDFEARWEERFIIGRDAELDREEPPNGWPGARGDRAARLTFLPAKYPALLVREPYPDWTGYDRLVFGVYSELEGEIELALRIHDAAHENDYHDRFNRMLAIPPGASRIEIALEEVRHAPREREMDLARIRNLALFAIEPSDSFSVFLDGFRLERD